MMGTSTALNPRTGRWVLDCGECGTADGTVRKRYCPAHHCYHAQLCRDCLATIKEDGRWAEWHRTCKADRAAYVAAEAAKDAEGERWARSAVGDWHEDVPAGMVKVTTRAGTIQLVPKADYRPGERLPELYPDGEPILEGDCPDCGAHLYGNDPHAADCPSELGS